jgi:hypothetical protein
MTLTLNLSTLITAISADQDITLGAKFFEDVKNTIVIFVQRILKFVEKSLLT